MAGRTYSLRSAMVHIEPSVIESCSLPSRRAVAGGTCGWESGRCMVGIRCALIVRFVTGVAICRNGRVVVVHMAVGASHCSVRTGQRKRCVVVIKARRLPGCSVVAYFALLRESRGHVVGVCSPIKVGQVATGARDAGQVVIAVDVTLSALKVGVGAC